MAEDGRGDEHRSDGDRNEPRDAERDRRDRLERAEARRRERRARAAAANRDLDRGGGDRTTDGSGDSDDARNGSGDGPGILPTVLRFAALVLLTVGFLGLTVSEAWLSPAGSPYAPVFGAGVVCAIVSIYLGIYRHGG